MERPIVTVKQGKLEGTVEENVLGSRRYIAFRGIPFAAPPLGELRFKDPEPPASWEGIRDASVNSGMSAQLELSFTTFQMVPAGTEDCLYLNVYKPESVYWKAKVPVMVWIHGGGFYYGCGNDDHKRFDYLLAKDVMIVSINYRLGALGFLNLRHKEVCGNQGLKDQVAALKWIKENIGVFGGDSDNITVFGVSAGSVSAHLLSISPLSKGLFHKAILQSGLGTSDWAVMRRNQPETNSYRLASILGCDSTDPMQVLEFLRTIPHDKLVETQHQVLTAEEARVMDVPFGPTYDDIAKTPFMPNFNKLLEDDNNIPIMIGYTTHEYIMFLKDDNPETLKTMYEELPLYVEAFTNSKDKMKVMQLAKRVKQEYFNNKPFTKESMPAIVRWLSDFHFKFPIKDYIQQRSKNNKETYFYQFSYVGNEKTETMLIGNQFTSIGTSHTDDMSYLFYMPKCKIENPAPPVEGTRDRKVVEWFTRMWTNFAKYGNPTPPFDQNLSTTWLPVTQETFNYLDIGDILNMSSINNYKSILQEMQF
ncbi:hypothetical protein PUN28_019520 [Cardiocondyla obscurior]